MFCRDRVWVQTPPICKGKGLCELDNGGCSHSCLQIFTYLTPEFLGISFEQNRTLECRCPRGLVLDANGKTCIKPVPKSLCRKVFNFILCNFSFLACRMCLFTSRWKAAKLLLSERRKMSACAWTAESISGPASRLPS